jgi:hypothetical protein
LAEQPLRLGQSKANTRQRHALEPAAVAEAQLHGPGGARRPIDWEEFALHAIQSAMCEMPIGWASG